MPVDEARQVLLENLGVPRELSHRQALAAVARAFEEGGYSRGQILAFMRILPVELDELKRVELP